MNKFKKFRIKSLKKGLESVTAPSEKIYRSRRTDVWIPQRWLSVHTDDS